MAMSVEEQLDSYGFRLAASCSGKAAYTKFVKHEGKRAYISVTSAGSESGLPTSMEERVQVVIYDLKSGDELKPGENFVSLKAFLESLKE
jgi:hypothetical protein